MTVSGRFITAFILLLLSCPQLLWSQTDVAFWFAVPEAAREHEDRPIRLRFSSGDQPTTVSVDQPANSSFRPIVRTIGANSSVVIDLTPFINILENRQPDQVRNFGLRIQASNPVTAYYELGRLLNTDIFALKGNNALGTNFYIPGQNFWDNDPLFSESWSSFDIVATEPNTIVQIEPSTPHVGHTDRAPYSVILQRGQTYSARAVSKQASQHTGGSRVTSNKPIAITVKDDGLGHRGGCVDIIGDQIVPVEVLGTEYVVIAGSLQSDEQFFVTATADSTRISLNGEDADITMQAGELRRFPLQGAEAVYLRSTEPVYVFHTTGIGCELGAALLPSINCKGSTTLDFTRSSDEDFYLNLLVRSGGQDDFTLNGRPLQASAFSPVPGANGIWQVAQYRFSTNELAVGSANRLSNANNSFQAGILDGGPFSGSRFGYFSNFSSLYIGDDIRLCAGESRQVDAGIGATSYTWSTGVTSNSITVAEAGTYWVEVTNNVGCTLTDTITVSVIEPDFLQLPDTVQGCNNTPLLVDAGTGFGFDWSDGFAGRINPVSTEGLLAVEVLDFAGCRDLDTTFVKLQESFDLDIGPRDTLLCEGDVLILDASTPNASSYQWQNGSTSPTQVVTTAGFYLVSVQQGFCTETDEQIIAYQTPPAWPLPDTTLCEGTELLVPRPAAIDSVVWDTGQTGPAARFSQAGVYRFTAEAGVCTLQDSFRLSYDSLPLLTLPPTQTICPGDSLPVTASQDSLATYRWSTGSTGPGLVLRDSALYIISASKGVCSTNDSIRLRWYPLPELPIITGSEVVCPGLSGTRYTLNPAIGNTQRFWQVSGGTLSNAGVDFAEVDWAVTNPDASIRAVARAATGCLSDTATLSVRINVFLETSIPAGESLICLNASDSIPYSTLATSGSIYTWQATGGTILSGQGSPAVAVRWSGPGRHQLAITEQSTTSDTVCFGASDTLQVQVFADSAALELLRVSYDSTSDRRILVDWQVENPQRLAEPLSLFYANSPLATLSPAPAGRYIDSLFQAFPAYALRTVDRCGQLLNSPFHEVIQLEGAGEELSDEVSLTWSSYRGWPVVSAYEVWRKVDAEQEFSLVATVPGNRNTYQYTGAEAGFSHQYRLRAIDERGVGSWSNLLQLDFVHELFIPNVITPNGDLRNDTFHINSLALYPDNLLRIYNRYGKLLYEQPAYQNDWAPATPGVYYYELLLQTEVSRVYRGWVQSLE